MQSAGQILNKLILFLSLWKMIHFLFMNILSKEGLHMMYYTDHNIFFEKLLRDHPDHFRRSQYVNMSEICHNICLISIHSYSCNLRVVWSFLPKRKHLAGLPHISPNFLNTLMHHEGALWLQVVKEKKQLNDLCSVPQRKQTLFVCLCDMHYERDVDLKYTLEIY